METKVNIDKFIASWLNARKFMSDNECGYVLQALREQGLECKDGEIVEIESDKKESPADNPLNQMDMEALMEKISDKVAEKVAEHIIRHHPIWTEKLWPDTAPANPATPSPWGGIAVAYGVVPTIFKSATVLDAANKTEG